MITKKQIVEAGSWAAEVFDDGGNDKLIEHYHGFSEVLPDEIVKELNQNTIIGEMIEFEMHVALAKKYARFAGMTLLPKAKPGYRYRLQKLPKK